ncbi:MAG: hypothetical protein IKT37_09375 [Clostridia bacterium]|nr:hypothetical protein [Clostridia bacterium]
MKYLAFFIPALICVVLMVLILNFKKLFGLESQRKRIFYFITITLLIFTVSFLFRRPEITPNQLFYFSSTLAQVCATLYSVTIAGYVLLEDKLNHEKKKDETLSDIVDGLKLEYRELLIYTGLLTFICVIFSVCNILIAESTKEGTVNSFLPHLFFGNALIFSFVTIVSVLFFVAKVTDPKKYIKASNKAIKESNEIKDNLIELSNKYVVDFIREYNKLERLIIDVSKNNDIKCYDNERLTASKCINYLRQIGIIDAHLHEELHALRKFRNYLIHGDNIYISKSVLDKVLSLSEEFEKTIQNSN